jgi:beta-glucosidase
MKFIRKEYEAKAKELLSRMTLEEKAGQLSMYGSFKHERWDDIKAGRVGAMINVPDVATANAIQKVAVEESRMGIPLLIGHDVVHGDRTLFPIPLAGASSWDMDEIRRSESIAASEAYAEGVNWIYSPMIDITREPRWGRIAEGAGEDKTLGSAVAAARVQGFQTINPETGYPYAAACFKHYCGYGLAEAGRDYESCDISERTLYSEYLPVYKAALDAGAMSCMSSFNSLNGVPVSGSRYYLTELLREKWGFEGLVVSDWESILELVNHRVAADRRDSAKIGILAGCDIDMHSGVYQENLMSLAEEYPEVEEAINEAAFRVLCVKLALGLFENPYRAENNESSFLLPESRAASRTLSRKSMVLLKNDSGLLPIKRDGKRYLLTGPMASAQYEVMGIWGGRGKPETVVSLSAALSEDGGVDIVCVPGCDFESDDRSGFDAALAAAADCDGIIYACGEPCQWAGEAGGRVNIDLPGVQNEYLDALKATGKPVIAVLMTSRPLACSHLAETADALLLAWAGGVEIGHAAADCLFGDYNPSARLPVTFPRATGQIPIYHARLSSGRPLSSNPRRYRDCEATPLFPFGYGLSYSTVEYGDVRLECDTIASNGTLSASVTVTNTSTVDCEEVVQAYFKDVVSSLATPDILLCDFKKVAIPAKASVEVSFSIPAEKFGFLDSKLCRVVEPGEFILYIGHDCTTNNGASFYVK